MTEKKAHIIGDRERTDDIHTKENVDFAGMYLSDHVMEGLKKSGFVKPSPIQLAAIPLGRCGLDLVVQAKSGTGKTCVFTVIALEMINVSARTTQVLVVAPTREIAVQIAQVINSIGSGLPGLRAFTFIGGIPLAQDKAKLGCCHIAVGTPGRLIQLVELGVLKLDNVRLFVLDEADQLLTGQFGKAMVSLTASLPLNKQMLAVSATYTDEVAKVAEELMRSPNHVRLGRDCPALLGVNQFVILLPYHHQAQKTQQAKMSELLSILSTITFNQCLVFTNSQFRAESICNQLKATGWPVAYLTGGQAQRDRLQALDALCTYKCRILISTDLSARGLDSEHVNLVINLDMPYDQATYLHRVGRAGRFGSRGGAITLAAEGDDWTTMRAIVTLANVKAYILQDGWESNITSKEVEGLEEVESLEEEALKEWLEASKDLGYSQKKGEKSQKNGKTDRELRVSGKKYKEESQKMSTTKKSNKPLKNVTKQENKVQNSNSVGNSGKKKGKETAVENGDPSYEQENIAEELEKNLAEEAKKKLAEKKAENQRKVLGLLSRLNISSSVTEFSYSDIHKELSKKYDEIRISENSAPSIPPLPNRLNATEQELKALSDHLEDTNEELKAKIENIDETWKCFTVDVKEALQAMIEGKDPSSLLHSCEKKVESGICLTDDAPILVHNADNISIGIENGNASSSVEKTDSSLSRESKMNTESVSALYQSSRSTSPTPLNLHSKEKTKSSVIPKEKLSKPQEKREKVRKSCQQLNKTKGEQCSPRNKARPKQRKHRQRSTPSSYESDVNSCHRQPNYRHYDNQQQQMDYWNQFYGSYASSYPQYAQGGYPSYGVGQATQKENEGAHNYQQQHSDYYHNYNYHSYYNPMGWDNTMSSYNYQVACIQSAQKFASMMEYVQSMGRMSAWIAQDYHSHSSQTKCDHSSKSSRRSKQKH